MGIWSMLYLSLRSSMLYKLPLLLSPQPEGGFVVTSPMVPELLTEGETVAEALDNVRDRPEADLYSFNLQDPIPVFDIPLQPEDLPIAIDLTHLLQEVYEQGCFDLQINYQSILPDLSAADLDWVKQVVDRSSASD